MCLNRIIQHHLGSSGDPSLPKSCHMPRWHETNSLALNGRGPQPSSSSADESQTPLRSRRTGATRGEVRSFAGLSLVLAPGAPAPGGGVLSAAAPRAPGGAGDDDDTVDFLRDGRRLQAPC